MFSAMTIEPMDFGGGERFSKLDTILRFLDMEMIRLLVSVNLVRKLPLIQHIG